jgi:hypothetical protein
MDARTQSRSSLVAVALTLAGAVLHVPARAQPESPHVGVVRATSEPMQAMADAVDAALLRDLSAVAGLESPVVSPVDYADIQLGVGCSDESRNCLLAITRAVRADALVLRRLGVDAQGNGQLELVYFQAASSDAPTTVAISAAPAHMESELVAAVPSLVRQLFGIAEVARPAAPVAVQAETSDPALRPTTAGNSAHAAGEERGVSAGTWIALGAGAAVLTAGILVGWTAQQDFRDWKERPLETRDQADDARAAFDDLRTRAIAADVLMPVGAVGIGLGITLLVLDLGREGEREGERATLAVTPAPGGAMLRVQGSLQEAL